MNPICTYYAIRKKGTYLFLPACDRGATHTEPVDCTFQTMRLFTKRVSANKALRAWVKGRWETHTSYSNDFGITEVIGIKVTPDPSRDIKDMEVVPIYLRLDQHNMI